MNTVTIEKKWSGENRTNQTGGDGPVLSCRLSDNSCFQHKVKFKTPNGKSLKRLKHQKRPPGFHNQVTAGLSTKRRKCIATSSQHG